MKNLLTLLATPSGAAYALFALGLLAAAFARTRRGSWWLLAASGLITVVFSSGMVAAAIMSPLEYSQPMLRQPGAFPEARHIVVLTGWASDDTALPLSGRMNASSAYRVLLALELYKERPDCDVIVSGEPVTARVMGDVLAKLGVPRDRLILEDKSLTTEASAANLKALLGNEFFFLVTSAGHLPRTLAAAEREGLQAIPAPTDFQLPKEWRDAEFSPRPESLAVSNLAIHEYLGSLWYALKREL
jgi:uncharacterized SAM-binding protein YcdF (DUF218 family)